MSACVLSCFSCVQQLTTLWTVACQAPLYVRFSGKNTGVGCHAHLQGIFLTQGSNPHLLRLLHWHVGSLPTTSATWEALHWEGRASLVAQMVKKICLQSRRCTFDPWVGKIPWRRDWQATPVFLPGKSHGQRAWRVQSIGLQRALCYKIKKA